MSTSLVANHPSASHVATTKSSKKASQANAKKDASSKAKTSDSGPDKKAKTSDSGPDKKANSESSSKTTDHEAGAGNGTSNNGASSSSSTSGGGFFRPFVVLALPGVNLFRKFSQYRRLPQDPPKDKLEVELDRLNNKIVSILKVKSV
jgi:hypothetical protein